jgi:hypothetical protein
MWQDGSRTYFICLEIAVRYMQIQYSPAFNGLKEEVIYDSENVRYPQPWLSTLGDTAH